MFSARGYGRVGANHKRGSKRQSEDDAEWEALFPFKDVELQSGKKVSVKQWNIDTGAVLTGRVVALVRKIQQNALGESVELDELLAVAIDECRDIVAATLGWSTKQLDQRCTWEDFMDLVQAVFDMNLMRADGGGVIKKVVDLSGMLVPLFGLQQPEQSTSSSVPDTQSPISEG